MRLNQIASKYQKWYNLTGNKSKAEEGQPHVEQLMNIRVLDTRNGFSPVSTLRSSPWVGTVLWVFNLGIWECSSWRNSSKQLVGLWYQPASQRVFDRPNKLRTGTAYPRSIPRARNQTRIQAPARVQAWALVLEYPRWTRTIRTIPIAGNISRIKYLPRRSDCFSHYNKCDGFKHSRTCSFDFVVCDVCKRWFRVLVP